MSFRTREFSVIALIAFALSLNLLSLGCGSGGGTGGLVGGGPASINVKVEPHVIDSGDRTTVTVDIGDFQENRVVLKVRIPVGLEYVDNSAYFIVANELEDTFPEDNETDETDYVYLVFYFSKSTFNNIGKGSLTFELRGTANVPSGRIEVDVDLDDPEVINSREFDILTPEFDEQDGASIRVGPEPTSTSSSSSSGTTGSSSSSSSSGA